MTRHRTPRRPAAVAGAVLGLLLVGAGAVALQPGPAPAQELRAAPAADQPAAVGPALPVGTQDGPVAVGPPGPADATGVTEPAAPAEPVATVAPAAPAPPPVAELVVNAADPGLDVVAALGPPPGPQDDARPARTAAPADRFALLVGVQDYRSPTVDTIGSVADVRLIADSLVAQGWRPENVRVLADAEASGRAVRDGLAWLAERGRAGTFSLFHYSGHVKSHGGEVQSLWPVDRDFVRDVEVTAALTAVQGRLWVDIAGCHAGSFADGFGGERVLFTSSSTTHEKSYEYPPWGRSVWTGLLFDLGLRQGHADADGDGRTTVGESVRWSTWAAQAITLGQRPHGHQTPQRAGDLDLGWTLADPPA